MHAAKFRRPTPLSAVQGTKLLWNSIYSVLSRFHALESFLENINDKDVQTLSSIRDERIDIHRLSKKLKDMNSITIKL